MNEQQNAVAGSRRGPGRPRKELHSEDFKPYQPPEIDASDLSVDPVGRGEVFISDAEMLKEASKKAYLDELAFGEELVTILLYRGQEEFAPDQYQFSVNGQTVWVPVETPTSIKRKYVEVIARSQPYRVRTVVVKPPENSSSGAIQNLWRREQSAAYPFTILEDKSPRAAAWLESVKRGN